MIVYLSGPIHNCTDKEINEWRDYCIKHLRHEFSDPRGKDPDDVVCIVEDDKDQIDKCDLLLANVWKIGVGTAMEIYHAWLEI